MAHISSQQPIDKLSAEANAENAVSATPGPEIAPQLQPARIEYDVDRVEQVYKKLDLRIIPGRYLVKQYGSDFCLLACLLAWCCFYNSSPIVADLLVYLTL